MKKVLAILAVTFAGTAFAGGYAGVEYEDQDQRVHQIWLDEIAKHGVESRMSKFIDETRFERKP
jgi:hypothetical protein